MKEKRRDSKGRILHTGESQRTDGKYLYKYVDAFGNTKYVYAWRLTPTDPTPKGKREKPSLRELEQQIRRDIEDGIDSTGKKMTLCQLYAKQNAQRANVKKSTQKQREQLMRLLKEDKLGARSIDTIKPSDAKEWALRMKDKGFSYNTINNHKRSLKASFYIAIQDDCVRKNPFDFKLSEVLENDTKEKVALTEEQEQSLLSFIKTDNVYHIYIVISNKFSCKSCRKCKTKKCSLKGLQRRGNTVTDFQIQVTVEELQKIALYIADAYIKAISP